jgi:hypothetical protein
MRINGQENISEKTSYYFLQQVKRHPLLFLMVVHSVIIMGLFTILNYEVYSEPGAIERWFAMTILNAHQLPYHDFVTEYPPLAILSFIFPALIFREPFSYSMAFAAEILLADLVILLLLSRLSGLQKIPAQQVLGAYTVFILAVGPLITIRHDMIPAMLVMIALYAIVTGRTRTAWVLLGLGVMTKVFPVIFAPLFAISHLFSSVTQN